LISRTSSGQGSMRRLDRRPKLVGGEGNPEPDPGAMTNTKRAAELLWPKGGVFSGLVRNRKLAGVVQLGTTRFAASRATAPSVAPDIRRAGPGPKPLPFRRRAKYTGIHNRRCSVVVRVVTPATTPPPTTSTNRIHAATAVAVLEDASAKTTSASRRRSGTRRSEFRAIRSTTRFGRSLSAGGDTWGGRAGRQSSAGLSYESGLHVQNKHLPALQQTGVPDLGAPSGNTGRRCRRTSPR